MKKYIKPELYYESFEVSQNVATCDWDMNQTDYDICEAVGDPDFGYVDEKVFTKNNQDCNMLDDMQKYCYEKSAGGMVIFNS